MHVAEDAHTNTQANANEDGHTHERVQSHSLVHYIGARTHPHTPSHYAPAVKSQLNNESSALLPLCIKAEELVIACMEQYVRMPLFQLQHRQPTWGIVS